MSEDNMRVSSHVDENGIATISMHDEEGKNTFTDSFIEEFVFNLDKLEARGDVRVCLIQGLPDVFCGGAEKEALLDLCDGKTVVKDLVISERLVSTPFPVIAAMEGHAIGGGLAVAVCCDVVIAARESRYGAVFMSMGFTPGMGITTLLPELMGPYVAAEMMYTGKRFRGSELELKGTNINYIVPRAEVIRRAADVARQIGDKNPKSVALLKYALAARKRKLLIDARVQEDMMHRISFGFPETRNTILDAYAH